MSKEIITSAIVELPRNEYGALEISKILSAEQRVQAMALINAAVKAEHLPAPFVTRRKKEFECMNLDVYDVLIFRGKVKSLVVQARSFWKDLQRGYTRAGKDYYLVTRDGRKTTVDDIEKATCAKRAKNTSALGQLVKHYQGKATVTCKKPNTPVSTAYKVLAKTDDGRLVSAFDDSEYETGKWRSEAARPNHGGGFYYYLDQQLAVDATKRGDTFAESVAEGKKLVLCEVEVQGKQIQYGGGKLAATRLRVIRELAPVEFDEDAIEG
jgi:hypothetical protein